MYTAQQKRGIGLAWKLESNIQKFNCIGKFKYPMGRVEGIGWHEPGSYDPWRAFTLADTYPYP